VGLVVQVMHFQPGTGATEGHTGLFPAIRHLFPAIRICFARPPLGTRVAEGSRAGRFASIWGRGSRSSQRGTYQFQSPSRPIALGRSTDRMMVALISRGNADAEARLAVLGDERRRVIFEVSGCIRHAFRMPSLPGEPGYDSSELRRHVNRRWIGETSVGSREVSVGRGDQWASTAMSQLPAAISAPASSIRIDCPAALSA